MLRHGVIAHVGYNLSTYESWVLVRLQPRHPFEHCCCVRRQDQHEEPVGAAMCWRGLDEMEEFENPFRPLPVEICHKGDPPARTFRVKLRRRQDGFGLNFDATDSAVLLVGWVPDGGAASQWNQKAQQKIQPYDRLLEVAVL